MDGTKELYSVLTKGNYYTKSLQEFESQMQNPKYRDFIASIMERDGLLTPSMKGVVELSGVANLPQNAPVKKKGQTTGLSSEDGFSVSQGLPNEEPYDFYSSVTAPEKPKKQENQEAYDLLYKPVLEPETKKVELPKSFQNLDYSKGITSEEGIQDLFGQIKGRLKDAPVEDIVSFGNIAAEKVKEGKGSLTPFTQSSVGKVNEWINNIQDGVEISPEDEKRWKEVSPKSYSQILKEYPISKQVSPTDIAFEPATSVNEIARINKKNSQEKDAKSSYDNILSSAQELQSIGIDVAKIGNVSTRNEMDKVQSMYDAKLKELQEKFPEIEQKEMIERGTVSTKGRGLKYSEELRKLENAKSYLLSNIGKIHAVKYALANPNLSSEELGAEVLKIADPTTYKNYLKGGSESADIKSDMDNLGIQVLKATGNPNLIKKGFAAEDVHDKKYPDDIVAETKRRIAVEYAKDKGTSYVYNATNIPVREADKYIGQLQGKYKKAYMEIVRPEAINEMRETYSANAPESSAIIGLPPMGGAINSLLGGFIIPVKGTFDFFADRVMPEKYVINKALVKNRDEFVNQDEVKKQINGLLSKKDFTTEDAKELDRLNGELTTQIPYKNFIDGTFQLTGQVLGQAVLTEMGAGVVSSGARATTIGSKLVGLRNTAAVVTKIARNAELVKDISGMAVGGLSSYSDAQKEAINLGLEGFQQHLYSGIVAGLNVGTERIFKDEKIFQAFMKDMSPLVANMVRDMSTNEISQSVLSNKITRALLSTAPKYVGKFISADQKEAFEEGLTQFGTSIAKGLLAPDKTNLENEINAIKQTYYETSIYSGITSGLDAKRQTKLSSINTRSLFTLGSSSKDVQQFIDIVNQRAANGDITQEEADKKIKAATNIRDIVQKSIPVINQKKPLTDAEKIRLSSVLLAERTLKDDIANPQLEDVKSINQKQLQKVTDLKDKILNDEVIISNDLNAYTPEEYKQKVKEDAIQEQTAGKVPVQPTTGVGEKMEEGVPEPKPQVPTEKVKKELPEGVTIESAITEDGETDYEAEDEVRKIAKDRDLGITSDREIAYVARDASGKVIGGAFTSYDGDKYTFDVVVDEANEGKGIGSNLLDAVQDIPSDIKDENPDAKLEVDVVNPSMQKMLEQRGFGVTKELGNSRVLMEKQATTQQATTQQATTQQAAEEGVSSKTPETVEEMVSSIPEQDATDITFVNEDGDKLSSKGNEQQLADLYKQAMDTNEDERTLAQQSAINAVESIKSKMPDKSIIEAHNEEGLAKYEDKAKTAEGKRLLSLADGIVKSLKSLIPDIQVYIHTDSKSYNNAMAAVEGAKNSGGNFYQGGDGKPKRIDINLNVANKRTLAHEAMHAVLSHFFGNNKDMFTKFKKSLGKVIISMGRQDFIGDNDEITTVNRYLKEFVSRYDRKGFREFKNEEYTVELAGILTDNAANISVSGWRKIALAIHDFVKKYTGIELFDNLNDTKDIAEFFKSVSKSFREGTEIEAPKGKVFEQQTINSLNQDFNGELFEQEPINLQGKLENDLPSTGRGPSKPSLRKDLVEREIVDKKIVVGKKYSVTMSDHTMVGSYHNKETGVKVDNLMGGVMFPYIKGIYDAGMAWASTGIKQARELVLNSVGRDFTLIYRMARSTGSRGNANFNQIAFAELIAPVTNNKVSEKVFLKQLNDKLNSTFSRKDKETGVVKSIKQNEFYVKILSAVGQKTKNKIELLSDGKKTSVNRIEIKSLNELKNFLESASFSLRGNFWSTILKNDNAKATLPWYKFLEKYNVQTIKGIVDAIAEVETDAAKDHDVVGVLKINAEYTENGLIKVYTPYEELVNEKKGIFYVDAPKHPSYKYYVSGKPIGLFNEFNSITEYFPIIDKWIKEGRLNSPYKAVETMVRELIESIENYDNNPTPENKSKASLVVHDDTGFVSTDFWIENLKGKTKYLDGVIKNILNARQELNKGVVKEEKVVKAYLITLASMGSAGGYYNNWSNKTGQSVSEIFLENENGKKWIRPEGAAAAYLVTDNGQKLIDDIINGKATKDQIMDMFSFVGVGRENKKTEYVLNSIKANGIKKMTDLFNENKGSDFNELYAGAIKNLSGIAEGKTGFFNQYFGVSGRGVVDARQLNAWVAGKMKLTEEQKKRIKQVSASKKLTTQLLERIEKVGLALGYPKDLAGYIAHHAIWDAIKKSITTHEGEYAVVSGRKLSDEEKKVVKIVSKASLVGMNAKLSEDILRDRRKAINYEKLGMPADKIRLLTNWEKAFDGEWRYELDSSKMKMKFEHESNIDKKYKLSDIISYPAFFDAYPEAKDVDVVFDDSMAIGEGGYNDEDNEIVLGFSRSLFNMAENIKKAPKIVLDIAKKHLEVNKYRKELSDSGVMGLVYYKRIIDYEKNIGFDDRGLVDAGYAKYVNGTNDIEYDENYYELLYALEHNDKEGVAGQLIKSVLLHEIQHKIQYVEDFAVGGNLDVAKLLMTPEEKKEYDKLAWKTAEMKVMMKRQKKKLTDLTDEEIEKYFGANSFLYEIYKRIAGETEARNVQARMNMSEKERRRTPLTATEDVPREKQIIRSKASLLNASEVKLKKAEDGEYDVMYNGESLGSIYFDKSLGRTWRETNYEPKAAWDVFGDVLGYSKEEAIQEFVNRYNEKQPKSKPSLLDDAEKLQRTSGGLTYNDAVDELKSMLDSDEKFLVSDTEKEESISNIMNNIFLNSLKDKRDAQKITNVQGLANAMYNGATENWNEIKDEYISPNEYQEAMAAIRLAKDIKNSPKEYSDILKAIAYKLKLPNWVGERFKEVSPYEGEPKSKASLVNDIADKLEKSAPDYSYTWGNNRQERYNAFNKAGLAWHGGQQILKSLDSEKIKGGLRGELGHGFYFGVSSKPLDYGDKITFIDISNLKFIDGDAYPKESGLIDKLKSYIEQRSNIRVKISKLEDMIMKSKSSREYDEINKEIQKLEDELKSLDKNSIDYAEETIKYSEEHPRESVRFLSVRGTPNQNKIFAKIMTDIGYDGIQVGEKWQLSLFPQEKLNDLIVNNPNKFTAEKYQEAKENGGNPKLIKAVDDVIGEQPKSKASLTPDEKKMVDETSTSMVDRFNEYKKKFRKNSDEQLAEKVVNEFFKSFETEENAASILEQAVIKFKKAIGVKVESSPTHRRIFGDTLDKETVADMASLLDRIKRDVFASKQGALATVDSIKKILYLISGHTDLFTREDYQGIIKAMTKLSEDPTSLDKVVDEIFKIQSKSKSDDIKEFSDFDLAKEKVSLIYHATRAGIKEMRDGMKLLQSMVENIKSMPGGNEKVRAGAILRALGRVNLRSSQSITRFIDYLTKVYEKADYAKNLSEALKLKQAISYLSNDDKKNPELKELGKTFLDIDPSLVDDIDAYIKMAKSIKESIEGSKLKSDGTVDFSAIANVFQTAYDISKVMEDQNKKLYDMLAQEVKVLLGVDVSGMSYEDLKFIADYSKGQEDEANKKVKRDTLAEKVNELLGIDTDNMSYEELKAALAREITRRAFDTNSAMIEKMLQSEEDPFTGYPVWFSDAQKEIISRFINMDLKYLDTKELLSAVDSLMNFIQNRSTANMETVLSKYNARRDMEYMIENGLVATKLRKYFSPAFGRLIAEQFVPLQLVFERMFVGTMRSDVVMKKMGINDIMRGANLAQSIANKTIDEYVSRFYSKKANGENFNTQRNDVERGMVAFMIRNLIGTQSQMKEEFNKRKELMRQTIEELSNGSEDEKKLADVYNNVYLKILENSNNIQDVKDKANHVNLDAVQFWIDEWSKHYDEMADVSLNVFNKRLRRDINYTVDRYRRLNSAPKESVDLNNIDSFFLYNNGTQFIADPGRAGSLMEAKTPSNLPKNRYIILSFDKNNSDALAEALVDTKTAAGIKKVAEFTSNKNFKKLFKSSDDAELLKRRINSYILNVRDKNWYVDKTEMSKFIKAINRLSKLGAAEALAGVFTPLKQTVSVGFNTIINTGGKLRLDAMNDKDALNFISNSGYGIENRGAQSQAQIESIDHLMKLAAQSKGEKALRYIEKANELQLKWFLQKPDVYIAKASWIAYYEKYLKDRGIVSGKINYKTHQLNTDAADYAEMMVNRQQNVSDPQLGGAMFTSKEPIWQFISKMVMPFASFRMNQSARFANDMKILFSKIATEEDKAIARKSLGGYSIEMAVFRGISAMISIVLNDILYQIRGADEDDEDRKKSVYDIFKANATNIITDVFSPLPVADKIIQAGVYNLLDITQNLLDVEDEDKINIYEARASDIIQSLGMFGITAERGKQLWDLAKLSATGEFKNNYGKTEYIRPIDRGIMAKLIPLALAADVGLVPSTEISTIIRKEIKQSQKNALKNDPKGISGDYIDDIRTLNALKEIRDTRVISTEESMDVNMQIQHLENKMSENPSSRIEKEYKKWKEDNKENNKELLQGYKNKTQMKKENEALYDKTFGDESEYPNSSKIKKLIKTIKKRDWGED